MKVSIMNENLNYKVLNRLIILVIGILLIGVGIYFHFFSLLKEIFLALIPFYIGFFLSWILEPVSLFLNNKFKIKKEIANFLSICLSIIIILFIFIIIIPLAFLQAVELIENFPQVWDAFLENLSFLYPNESIAINQQVMLDYLNQKIQEIGLQNLIEYATNSISIISESITQITRFFMGIAVFIMQIIFGYVIAFYFMGSIKNFVKSLTNLIGGKNAKRYQFILISMSKAIFSYLRGLIIISTYVGIVMTIGSALLGLDTPILFGFISAITNVVPYIGPILGGIPIFIVALSIGYKQAILVVVLISIIQFIEAYFLMPKVMSKTVDLHPVSIMVGLLIFHVLFGFIGLILATPAMAMINVLIDHTKYKGKIKL